MQPYREGMVKYESTCIHDLSISYRDGHVAIQLPEQARIWSSAVFNGGQTTGNCIINHMVNKHFVCNDPVQYMKDLCMEWRYEPADTVGLITAAKITHLSVEELEGDEFSLLCCSTAGTSNAARAGVPREVFSSYLTLEESDESEETAQESVQRQQPGTINTVIVLDGKLTDAAVWNLLMVAAEAKAAALSDLVIQDRETGMIATGTTTDTVVIAVLDRGTYIREHLYGGTATTLGCSAGQLVYRTVYEAVRTQSED